MWVRCISSTTSRSMPRGTTPRLRHISWRFLRCVFNKEQLAFLLAELAFADFGDVQRYFVVGAVADGYAQVERQLKELLLVLNLEISRLALGHELECLDDAAAVVAVGR